MFSLFGKDNRKFQEAGKLKYLEECFKCLHCRKPFQKMVVWGKTMGRGRALAAPLVNLLVILV